MLTYVLGVLLLAAFVWGAWGSRWEQRGWEEIDAAYIKTAGVYRRYELLRGHGIPCRLRSRTSASQMAPTTMTSLLVPKSHARRARKLLQSDARRD